MVGKLAMATDLWRIMGIIEVSEIILLTFYTLLGDRTSQKSFVEPVFRFSTLTPEMPETAMHL
jgi:hypothetical protein